MRDPFAVTLLVGQHAGVTAAAVCCGFSCGVFLEAILFGRPNLRLNEADVVKSRCPGVRERILSPAAGFSPLTRFRRPDRFAVHAVNRSKHSVELLHHTSCSFTGSHRLFFRSKRK
uniref:(northern house mosquito) hypothetical protein n=1 Tax=Culex pipiens TaxID=7175 RepID=A0A8D8AGE6_CULPI